MFPQTEESGAREDENICTLCLGDMHMLIHVVYKCCASNQKMANPVLVKAMGKIFLLAKTHYYQSRAL